MATASQHPTETSTATRPTTLAAAFERTVAASPESVALRTHDGAVEITWTDYAARSGRIAAALHARGVTRGHTVGLLMANRPEFHLLDAAAFRIGAVPFSLYATLPPEQIAHVLGNARNEVLVLEAQFVDRVREAEAVLGRSPLTLVTIDERVDGAAFLPDLEAEDHPSFDLAAAGAAVQPDDLLTLIYTSGTTGPPKGVEITHANMLAQVAAVAEVLSIEAGDTITSYLPSAHIADRWSSHYNGVVRGVQITTVADAADLGAALAGLRPTIWGGVPRVLEKIQAKLVAGIAADPDEGRRAAVQGAIQTGIEVVRLREAGEPVPADLAARHEALEQAVLSGLRARLGLDRVKWILVGAAPLPRNVHEFWLGIGLPLFELYGMSECSCVVSAVAHDEARIGTVGKILPGLQAKQDADGELLVQGPTVFRGYRDQPDKTAEAFTDDGWYRTGDIVTVADDGHITIVDRKKEIIINAAGKNMSPTNIEQELTGSSPLIGQAAVIGDGQRYVVALLVLDPDGLAAFSGGRLSSAADAVADPEVRAEVAAAVERANARLARVEQIKRFELLGDEWLPGGDELTPTMKLKRGPIAAKYADVIDALYAG